MNKGSQCDQLVERSAWIRENRYSQISMLAATGKFAFVGDSLIESGEWNELVPGVEIANKGISGETSVNLRSRIAEIIAQKPAAIVGMVGINDLLENCSPEATSSNIVKIAHQIRDAQIPLAWHTIVRVSPPRPDFNSQIEATNRKIIERLSALNVEVWDLNPILSNMGLLKKQFSADGLHLNGEGYFAWSDFITPRLSALATK